MILFAGIMMIILLIFNNNGNKKDSFIFEIKSESLDIIKAQIIYQYFYAIILIISGLTTLCLDQKSLISTSCFYKIPIFSLISK